MLTSLALIFLVGLSAAAICGRLRLPRIIGMLFTGIILGPHVLGLLDDKILSISSELRQMALIINFIESRAFFKSCGSEKSRPSGSHDVVCTGKL
mgnify:CR=1 FL=1